MAEDTLTGSELSAVLRHYEAVRCFAILVEAGEHR
jgi:hypothetical protein